MKYDMGGTILNKTVKEIDLGVTMNASMKVSEQCRIAASKGNHVLGMIRRNIYIYIMQILSVCVCVCVCLSVKYRRPNCWTDHDQIWHAYADRPGNGSYQKLAP